MPISATTGPRSEDPDDAELVRRACAGDPRAWELIVDRHLALVNAVARSYRLSVPDREDAVQTVWLTLNQHLPRLRAPDRLRAWLRRVTSDVCARQRRRALRQRPVDPHLLADLAPADGPDPESAYLERERHDELHRAIRRLTDARDRIAVLHYLDETPAPEWVHGAAGPRAAANHRRRIVRSLRRLMKGPE
ncbi:RNA polymerase sigma factor [Nocardiopsis sp. Huas11]|uniref:RNA polymerase sigma factor n=1 Tax=Nocardiopsis sp. Huas11 TaxID=2183912 RepID=UPI001F190A55|nr:sigma-70 family RNA polymerase sigma factor [Nocardiopsis sp. Huas11]